MKRSDWGMKTQIQKKCGVQKLIEPQPPTRTTCRMKNEKLRVKKIKRHKKKLFRYLQLNY
jgi:hypothetical protein